MIWLRLEAGLFSSPDFQDLLDRIGPTGGLLWIYILCRAKERGEGGYVTDKDVSSRHMMRVLRIIDRIDYDIVLEPMLKHGLIERVEGGYQICNWFKYQQDRTNAERQRRFREKQKSNAVTDKTGVTLRNGCNDIQDPTVQDKTKKKDKDKQDGKPPAKKKKASKWPKGYGRKVWASYSKAYEESYGCPPTRNPKQSTHCCRIRDRLGGDMAPLAAAYYLTIRSRYYLEKGHSLGALEADCEKVLTEMRTSTQITSTGAREQDRLSKDASEWAEIKREHAAKGAMR